VLISHKGQKFNHTTPKHFNSKVCMGTARLLMILWVKLNHFSTSCLRLSINPKTQGRVEGIQDIRGKS